MIQFNNIKKSFDGKVILDGLSNVFEPGRCNLIIGASGEGKSVLLKCLVGIIQPDGGNVLYNGRDFWGSKTEARKQIRRELGMLFQGSALFDSKTVQENVMFPLDMLTKMTLPDKLDRVNFVLKRVGLEGTNNKMPAEISGGMQKRVGIARAIVLKPKYLFCDEPNSGLDPTTAIKIDELIMEITRENNITTVIVTHDMNSVMGIGEHVMLLSKGKKVWEGSKDTVWETGNEHINQFVFASPMMRDLKKMQ